MAGTLLVATRKGLLVCEPDEADWRVGHHGLEGIEVTSVASQGKVVLAGTTQGIFRSKDAGLTWQGANNGLDLRHVRWLACHPEVVGLAFAGTEPAEIYISTDCGENWRPSQEVARLRQAGGWYLPYSPAAGCVRGFDFHAARAYGAAEVGGVLRSDDFGKSWKLVESGAGLSSGQVNSDVHSIVSHPSSPDLVYAPTGGGFYRSQEGGASWDLLYSCYCRAAWVNPADPAHIVLGPADGVDRNGRVEVTRDNGHTWKDASTGLETPWQRHMVERFHQVGDELLAVLSNGELYAAELASIIWRRIMPDVNSASAVVTQVG